MSQPNPHGVAADASTAALVDNAGRLGLKWDLRQATVIKIELDPHHGLTTPDVFVAVDGDDATVKATSMIQDIVKGERVFVLIVPPGGIFICGRSTSLSVYTARQTLVSTQSQVTFSDIPSNLRELELGWSARSDNGAAIVQTRIRINNIGSASYTTEITQGNGAATASALLDFGATSAFIGNTTGAGSAGGIFGCGKVWFQGWDQTNSRYLNWTFNNAVMASGGISEVGGGAINIGAAANELDIIASAGSFIAGSDFYLRGTFS